MSENILTAIAIRVLTLFLLSENFLPDNDHEITDYGPHRIWTVSTCVPFDMDLEALKVRFQEYLAHHNACLTAAKFGFYDCVSYPCSHCGGQHLYLSIYQ